MTLLLFCARLVRICLEATEPVPVPGCCAARITVLESEARR